MIRYDDMKFVMPDNADDVYYIHANFVLRGVNRGKCLCARDIESLYFLGNNLLIEYGRFGVTFGKEFLEYVSGN